MNRSWRDPAILFSGRLISAAGDKLFSIALSWWAVSQHPTEAWVLPGLLVVNTLPLVILGPLLGPLVDRTNRKLCMASADLLRTVVATWLAVEAARGTLGLVGVFVGCALLTACTPLFEAAASASLGQIAPTPEDLDRLVAWDSAVPQVSSVLGALGGGVALALGGTSGSFTANAASFAISAACVLALRTPLPAPEQSEDQPDGGGYGFLRQQRAITGLLAVFAGMNFFLSPLFVLLPIWVKERLHDQDGTALARLELAFAGGALLAFLALSARPLRASGPLQALAGVLLALGVGSVGFSDRLLVDGAGLAVAGAAIAAINVWALGHFQRAVADEHKGRFFALLGSVCMAATPLAYAATGGLLPFVSNTALFAGSAAGLLVLGLLFARFQLDAQAE